MRNRFILGSIGLFGIIGLIIFFDLRTSNQSYEIIGQKSKSRSAMSDDTSRQRARNSLALLHDGIQSEHSDDIYLHPITGEPAHRKYKEFADRVDNIKSELQESSDPSLTINELLEQISQCPGDQQQLLWSSLVTNLSEHGTTNQALDFLSEFGPILQHALSDKLIGNGLNAYEVMVANIYEQSKSEGVSISDIVKASGDRYLVTEFAPLLLASTGSWRNQVVDDVIGTNKDKIEDLQNRTIKYLAQREFRNLKAVDLLLDPDYIVPKESGAVAAALERRWFWGNTEAVMEHIENAAPGAQRDSVLNRAIELMSEIDNAAAVEWTSLIYDESLKIRIRNALNNGN